jgi:hypothetical protein
MTYLYSSYTFVLQILSTMPKRFFAYQLGMCAVKVIARRAEIEATMRLLLQGLQFRGQEMKVSIATFCE